MVKALFMKHQQSAVHVHTSDIWVCTIIRLTFPCKVFNYNVGVPSS